MLRMDTATIDQAIGRKLAGLRTERNLSQEQLATASGISESTIYRLEQGSRSIRAEQLYPICVALGTTMHAFLESAMDLARSLESQGESAG